MLSDFISQLSAVPQGTWWLLLLFVIFWFILAIKHPWVALSFVALGMFGPTPNILNNMAIWSVILFLIFTSTGRFWVTCLVGGFIAQLFLSKKFDQAAKADKNERTRR